MLDRLDELEAKMRYLLTLPMIADHIREYETERAEQLKAATAEAEGKRLADEEAAKPLSQEPDEPLEPIEAPEDYQPYIPPKPLSPTLDPVL